MGVHKCADRLDGDNFLSPFEQKLWSLTYACLYRFGCPVLFNVFGPNCPNKIDQTITFFVPSNNINSHLVLDYLHQELDGEIRPSQTIQGPNGEEYMFGTNVQIMEFSGTQFYLESDVIERMALAAFESFSKKLTKS